MAGIPEHHGRACRNGENRVCALTIPIIFVPGIMGSRIDIPSTQKKWDADSTANMLSWALSTADKKRRMLCFENPGVVMKEPKEPFGDRHEERVKRGWGGLRWASYSTILEFLDKARFGMHRTPVYAYGYDWRQPALRLGCELAADILGETVSLGKIKAEPSGRFGKAGILARHNAKYCILISHSMGGLVSRTALLASSALQGKAIGVLHGVQPAIGAPVMFRRLATGCYSPYDGTGVDGSVFSKILGNTGSKFATLVSVLPGACNLLPSNEYRDACAAESTPWLTWTIAGEDLKVHSPVKDKEIHDIFRRNQTSQPPGGIHTDVDGYIAGELNARFDGAKIFHEKLGKFFHKGKTWAFFGNGKETDVTVHYDIPDQRKAFERLKANLKRSTSDKDEKVKRDKMRNGFNPNPACPKGKWNGRCLRGDGTVPAHSGAALFAAGETQFLDGAVVKGAKPDYPLHEKYQFEFDVEHEPAFRDAKVQDFTKCWLDYILARAPRK